MATALRNPMVRMRRILVTAILVALASLVLSTCAYFEGFWPQRLAVTVEGPAGWRLIRIDDRACDEPLPTRASKFLSFRPNGQEVACLLEAASGATRARCRVRALNVGGFVTGHQALPRGVESLDGSLWLLGDWEVTARPGVEGHVWFGCETNGRRILSVDGSPSEFTNTHAHSLRAGGSSWHMIDGDSWVLTFIADAGAVVHVAEWPEPHGLVIRCADAGFSDGTLAVDGAAAAPINLKQSIEAQGREFGLHLEAPGGARVQVRLNLRRAGLNLRVSRGSG